MSKLIVGNWKMNGSLESVRALIAALVNRLDAQEALLEVCDFVVCPTFLHISAVRHALYGFPKLTMGAQDCAAYDDGAYTGEVSARMLKDAGCRYVVLGHSERRSLMGERSGDVARKVSQALAHDLIPIVCIGETREERDAGHAEQVVAAQLEESLPSPGVFDEVVVAYEPVWAIGTGQVATIEDIARMHGFIRRELAGIVGDASRVRLLYGGSVKPDNARGVLACPDVDGALVGGASLDVEQFLAIARAAQID